jgi:hypothetical protein
VNLDPEFTRMLTRVVLVAAPVGVLAAAALVVAYRAFAPSAAPGRDLRAVIITAGTIAFVLLACVVFMLMSTEWR